LAPYEAHDPAAGCGLMVIIAAFAVAVLVVLAILVVLTR
jgi:hypothetical protein